MSPKVTEAYKEEKRAAILEGALHCFTEKGFQATKVEDIVRHLGMSKGAIYGYFASKEDMYIQMANSRMDAMVDSLHAQFKDVPGAIDKIKYLFNRFRTQNLNELRRWLTFHLEFMLYAMRQPVHIETMANYSGKAIRMLEAIIQEGKRTGECRSDLNEHAATYLFWAVRDGLALQFLLEGAEADYLAMLNEAEQMVLRYIRNS